MTAIPYLIYVFIATMGTLVPYMYSLNAPSGLTFTPLNDGYHLCTDARFYFSYVRELQENFFRLHFPVEQNSHLVHFDVFRASVHRLNYILGGFIEDARLAFPLSYFLCVLLGMIAMHFFLRKLSISRTKCLIITVGITLLYPAFIQLVALRPGLVEAYITHNLLNLTGLLQPELLNSNFRYTLLAGAMPLLWGTWYLISRPGKLSKFQVLQNAVSIYVIQFTYFPIALHFDLSLAFLLIVFLLNKKRVEAEGLSISIGIALCVFILCGGGSQIKNLLMYMPTVITESHQATKQHWDLQRLFKFTLLNLSPWLFVYFLPINHRKTISTEWAMASLAAFNILSLSLLLMGHATGFERTLIRGHGVIWSLACIVLIAQFRLTRFLRKPARTALAAVFVASTLGALGWSAHKMAASLEKSAAFHMRLSKLDAFKFINQNIQPNAVFFTTTVTDMQLLPVYTDQDLYVSGGEFSQDPYLSLTRYIHGLKEVTGHSDYLINALPTYFQDRKQTQCLYPPDKKKSWEESLGHNTLKHLLYDPYINQFSNTKIRDKSGLTSSFVKKVLEINSAVQSQEKRLRHHVDYIMVSHPFTSNGVDGFRLVFKSKDVKIFERITISRATQ